MRKDNEPRRLGRRAVLVGGATGVVGLVAVALVGARKEDKPSEKPDTTQLPVLDVNSPEEQKSIAEFNAKFDDLYDSFQNFLFPGSQGQVEIRVLSISTGEKEGKSLQILLSRGKRPPDDIKIF